MSGDQSNDDEFDPRPPEVSGRVFAICLGVVLAILGLLAIVACFIGVPFADGNG